MIAVPFPYYGGKGRVAEVVWRRFGNPDYYYEPFAGGLGVLLARSSPGKYEFISDADGFVTNFWRAAKYAPDDVAHYADDPPNSIELIARAYWLKKQEKVLLERVLGNPEYYDAQVAGWWAWCQSSSINSNNDATLALGRHGGIHRERRTDNLPDYVRGLSDRLNKVRIFHGDWTRLAMCSLRNAKQRGKSAIFLDPPYTHRAGRQKNLYAHDSLKVGHYVQRWALHAAGPDLKVALCGYAGEYDMPPSWEEIPWKSLYGRGRERIWFSP